MLKTHLLRSKTLLSLLVLLFTLAQPLAAQQGDNMMTLEQVKAKIAKLGVGDKAKATIKLKDGVKTKGYIAQAGDDEFVIRDRKTNAPTTIRYADVAKVEANRGHSTARNIGIGIGIGVGEALHGGWAIQPLGATGAVRDDFIGIGVGAFVAIVLITIAHLD